MTDQTIPADKARKIVNDMRRHADHDAVRGREEEYVGQFADLLEALLPDPPRPTMADMSPVERHACRWMQADTETWGRVVIVCPITVGGDVILLDRCGDVIHEAPAKITPRPDLPRMMWPSDREVAEAPAPAPTLPEGWRLADHPEHGRVIVTTTTPDDDGDFYFMFPADDLTGYDWDACRPDELTFLDQGADQ